MIAPDSTSRYQALLDRFGGDAARDVPLARYTLARLGGPADVLIDARTCDQLRDVAILCWRERFPLIIIGNGANLLFSDDGFRGVVLINSTKRLRFAGSSGVVMAESGVSMAHLARESMIRGLSGFEWAISVPGTVGGGVVNNAGAHGSDIAANLRAVQLCNPCKDSQWQTSEKMAYRYRESSLKHGTRQTLVLRTIFRLTPGHDPVTLRARADDYSAHRKQSQPPGASLGSMFKNPPGDYAGRLIETAGLKGTRAGGVMISPLHANFFVNMGNGTASDYLALIQLAQATVQEQFGVRLELEVELIGEALHRERQ